MGHPPTTTRRRRRPGPGWADLLRANVPTRPRRSSPHVTDNASLPIAQPHFDSRPALGNCAVWGRHGFWIDHFPAIPPLPTLRGSKEHSADVQETTFLDDR